MKAFTEETGKRRVAVYIRVSTAEQKIEGYGTEAQRKKLLEYAEQNKALNLEIKQIFEDVHTGSDLQRPALKELRDAVKEKKFDAVLVWKIDRLSRSLKHLLTLFEEMKSHDVSFISIQENIDFKGAIGNLIFQIFGAIAQFERELIKGRTHLGIRTSAELGNFTGTHIPYGYKPVKKKGMKGKRVEIIPEEKKWVRQMYEWCIYEDLGAGQIAKKLNELKAPRGEYSKAKDKYSPWSDKMVTTILTNTLYRGEFLANKKDEDNNLLPETEWIVVSVPPCVSEFTFQQAQNARKERAGGTTGRDYILSGKLKDMTLKKPKSFVGAKRFKGGFSYRRKQFKTKTGKHIPVFEVPGEQIEEYVWGKIMDALKNPEVFIRHYLAKENTDPNRIQKLENQLNNLREQRINTEIAIARIEAAYENGAYGEEKMVEKSNRKHKEIAQIEGKIQEIEDELSLLSSFNVEVEKLKDASKKVKYRLENLNRKQKKILCGLFVDRIEMYRKKVGKRWKIRAEIFFRFNPEKFGNADYGDRTSKKPQKANKGNLKSQKVVAGGTRRLNFEHFFENFLLVPQKIIEPLLRLHKHGISP